MANANLIELETSLADCIKYCAAHPDSELTRIYQQALTRASHKLHTSIATSDDYHVRWRTEERQHLVAWKQMATELNNAKRRLRSVNKQGFLEGQVLYWDREILANEARQMIAYLSEQNDVDFASGTIERLQRHLDTAETEGQEELRARKDFQRFVDVRREAMSEAGSVIGEFRGAMRRVLGKKHEDYQSIFWPYAIASDDGVLF